MEAVVKFCAVTEGRTIMLRATVIAVVLLVATAQAGFAATIIGRGVASCGTWTADRRAPNGGAAIADEGWVVGFLSGANVESEGNSTDFLVGTDADAIFAYIDNYCSAHPLDQISTGAVHLRFELKARADKRK
jgi:hypothetical protein